MTAISRCFFGVLLAGSMRVQMKVQWLPATAGLMDRASFTSSSTMSQTPPSVPPSCLQLTVAMVYCRASHASKCIFPTDTRGYFPANFLSALVLKGMGVDKMARILRACFPLPEIILIRLPPLSTGRSRFSTTTATATAITTSIVHPDVNVLRPVETNLLPGTTSQWA